MKSRIRGLDRAGTPLCAPTPVEAGAPDLSWIQQRSLFFRAADVLKTAGTVCRSASGTCDVTETCTGSSAACPTNAFKASGISCDDGQLCTYGDVCNGAGSCGGTTITCGGGNACSTTVCNGTDTCEPAKVFCNAPPGECYNTLGACNTTNGSCSYTIKTGAPCGTRGTCLGALLRLLPKRRDRLGHSLQRVVDRSALRHSRQ
jgi:hypothetical protein